MVKGRPPLTGKRPEMMSIELRRSPPRLSPDDGISEELCEFAEFILQTKPTSRPTALEILNHPYLAGTELDYPTSSLLNLVSDFKKWFTQGGTRQSLMLGQGAAPPQGLAASAPSTDDDDDWRFSRAVDPEELQKLQQQLASSSDSSKSASLRRTPSIKVDAVEDFSHNGDSRYLLQPMVYTPGASPRTPSGLYQTSPPATSPDDLETPTVLMSNVMDFNDDLGPNTEPFAIDDRAAQRGGSQLTSIFNKSEKPYHYGDDPKLSGKPAMDRSSDLPLRSVTTSSDVRAKEVLAPDPNKPRLIAPGSIPDISAMDINTIKQNRLASRSAGASPYTSESSGDERYESSQEAPPKIKRDTMAWTPDWGNVTEPESDTYTDPDPFAQFGYQTSASSLAPPPQRPSLIQTNSAPAEVPQVNARASTASVMDLDALMGDLGTPAPLSATPSYMTPSLTTNPDSPQAISEPATSPQPISPLPPPPRSESPEQQQHQQQHRLSITSPPTSAATAALLQQHQNRIQQDHPHHRRRLSMGPVLPPSTEAMANGAPSEVMIAEMERLLGDWDAEFGDLADEFAAASALDGPEEEMEELGEEADEEGDEE